MKNTKLVVLSILTVLLTCTSLLAGCTQTSDPVQTTQPTGSATTSTKAPDADVVQEPVEISYWGYWCANATDGNYCESLIEEALNIDIKTVNISQSEQEQINLMLTSGEMPDCGWFGKDITYMYDDNGLSRTIPKSMVDDYAPGFSSLMAEYPILEALVVANEDGSEYYGLPTFQEFSAGNQYFYTDFYRKDWLDALGIEYPGAVEEVTDGVYFCETGYTLEDHAAILEAFTTQDPDGNGENDTVGTIGAGTSALGLLSWTTLGAYGLCSSFSVEDNGQAVYYYSTERYKDMLAYLRDLYQAGYIDAEITTLDNEQFYEKAENSYGGHFTVSANWLGSWASNRPPLNILNGVEGAEILVTPGLIGPNGDMGSRQYAAVPVWAADFYFYVNSKVTDDNKLMKILEFVEYANFGEEKTALLYGEEGVDFTYDADGYPVRSSDFTEQNEKGIQAYSLVIQDAETLTQMNDSLFRSTFDYTVDGGLWIQYLYGPYTYDLYHETDLNAVEDEYGSSIDTIVEEFMVGVVTGETDLDAQWETYLENLNNAGYDEICAELNKAPLYSELTGE